MADNSSVHCVVCGVEGPEDEFIKQRTTHLDECAETYPSQSVALNMPLDVEYEYECEDHAIRRQVRLAHREKGLFHERCH